MRRSLLALAFVVAWPRVAFAEPAQTDAVIAQSLFDEGRTLLAAGKVKEACVKFAESQKLDPGGGTLLNLALCHEREGRIATASAELEAATAQAIKDGRSDRETLARDHFAALQPRVPRVVVDAKDAAPDETISIDGHALPRAAWGTPTAIDPGDHEFVATATGRKRWAKRIRTDEKMTTNVHIPALDVDPNAPLPPAPTATPAAAAAPATWPTVHVDSDDPEAQLEENREVGPRVVVVNQGSMMVDDGTRWFFSCTTPCDKPLDPARVYRVNGKGITPSKPFTLPSGESRVDLKTKTGSYARAVSATVLGSFGIAGIIGGVTMIIVGQVVPDRSSGVPWTTAGAVTLGSGAVLTIAAVVLGLGATTDVQTRAAR